MKRSALLLLFWIAFCGPPAPRNAAFALAPRTRVRALLSDPRRLLENDLRDMEPGFSIQDTPHAFYCWNRNTPLTPRDRDRLEKILSGDEEMLAGLIRQFPDKIAIARDEAGRKKEGRTVYLELDMPIETETGRMVRHLRIKGARPRTRPDGIIAPYSVRGDGHSARKPVVDPAGNIRVLERRDPGALGTLAEKELSREFRVLHEDGGRAADRYLGHGYFRDRYYRETGAVSAAGFVIAGMETADFRLVFLNPTSENRIVQRAGILNRVTGAFKTLSPEQEHALFRDYGRLFRSFHDRGLFHQTPHPGNLGIAPQNGSLRPVVRDFDSSLLRRDFDRSAEENRDRETALRFLDLSVVLFSLHVETISIFLDSRADSRHLIEPFLEGYFEELDETGLQALVSACRKKSFASKFARLNGGEPRFGFKAEPLNRLRLSVSDETFGGLAERLRALQAPAAPLVSEGDLLAPHSVSAISA